MFHEVGADDLEDEFEDDGNTHPQRQHAQRGVTLRRDDPVIDLHGVQRRPQGQQVNQRTGNGAFDKDLLMGEEGALEERANRIFVGVGIPFRQNQAADG